MDNETFDDDVITQFCEVADTTPEVAKNYLSVADGILENALQLFFSGFEIPKKAEPIPVDDNIEGEASIPAETVHHQPPPPSDDVRAPIAATTDILVDDYNFGSWQQTSYQQSFQALDPFRDFSTETEEIKILGDGEELDEETWNKSAKLSELFKIPYDIIFNGSFSEARDNAKKASKWLLVNIQDTSEFACQVLNRDLWKNEDVKDLIKQNFIFVQYPITSREGQQYKQFYPFEKYPHISLVDPRTGERIRVWDDVVAAEVFVNELCEFLVSNSLSSNQPLRTDKGKDESPPKINYDTMTEDEQIKAAIEMSMKDQKMTVNDPIVIDDDEDEYFIDDDDDYESGHDDIEIVDSKSNDKDEMEEDKKVDGKVDEKVDEKVDSFDIDPSLTKDELCEKFHKKFKAVVNPEPTSGNVTGIQFRLPDGKRVVRSFLSEDKVLVLFEYIKGSIPEAKEQPFDLLNFRESLIDKVNQTLHEAGVEDSAISVSYI